MVGLRGVVAHADGFVIQRVERLTDALFGFDAMATQQLGELLKGHPAAFRSPRCMFTRRLSSFVRTVSRRWKAIAAAVVWFSRLSLQCFWVSLSSSWEDET